MNYEEFKKLVARFLYLQEKGLNNLTSKECLELCVIRIEIDNELDSTKFICKECGPVKNVIPGSEVNVNNMTRREHLCCSKCFKEIPGTSKPVEKMSN